MAKVLTVTVIEGRDLAAKDKTGFSDPYVIVTVGAQKKKTKKIMQTLNPQWNESLTFDHVDDRMRVDMKCKDWDKFGGHDFMGEFSVPSTDLQEAYNTGNAVEKWYPLLRHKDKDVVKGDIKIRLVFSAAPVAAVHAPSSGSKSPRRLSTTNMSPAEVDAKIQSLTKQREALDSMTKAYERSNDTKSAQVSNQQIAQIDSELAQLRQQQAAMGGAPSSPQPQTSHQPSGHPLAPPTHVNIGGGSTPPPPPPPPGPGAAHHIPPTPSGSAPQPGLGASQPGFGGPGPVSPQPGFGAPQHGYGVPHQPSTGMMQPGGPTPPPRGVSNGGMLNVPTHGSSNRLSGVNPNIGGNVPLPNHQPSEQRLSGGMGGGNPKLVPPRQMPPTPPQPGMNTGGAPQPPTRTLPTPGGNRPMPPTTPPPQAPSKPKVRVLYEFPAENPGELHVTEGDILEIDNADDTWFTATKNGVTGWFPTNYAERI